MTPRGLGPVGSTRCGSGGWLVGWEGWTTGQRWLGGRDGQWDGGGCLGRMGNGMEVFELE